MIYYQIHPVHGQHMAVTLMEAEANEKSGWKSVSEKEFYEYGKKPAIVIPDNTDSDEGTTANLTADEVDQLMEAESHETEKADEAEQEATGEEMQADEIPRAVLEELYVAKFGKRPHGKMKDETIKEKLEAE